jgi:UDP-N-acetylglucosamine 2-epimerase
MSQVFFKELESHEPDDHLSIGGEPTARTRTKCWRPSRGVILKEKPDWVLVHSDTNSTLSGIFAAVKLLIPVAQ